MLIFLRVFYKLNKSNKTPHSILVQNQFNNKLIITYSRVGIYFSCCLKNKPIPSVENLHT